jgi:histidinol-phosphatase
MYQTDLDKALHLADTADAISNKHFLSQSLQITTKPDKTPVTDADLAVDEALRAIVTNEFKDAYLSEEGDQTHRSGRQWVVDPIDGTKNFLRGNPIWATLISVQDESGTLAAVVTAPALGRRWWAARGQGAWTRDVDGRVRQIHVSKVTAIADAYVTYCSMFPWEESPAGLDGLLTLLRAAWRERSPGDFLGHVFVAEGCVDACFEPNTKEWDMAAHAFIVQEAGGSVVSPDASSMDAEAPRPVITCNGLLEGELRHALKILA